jgi:GT2 family glycosyltransferase
MKNLGKFMSLGNPSTIIKVYRYLRQNNGLTFRARFLSGLAIFKNKNRERLSLDKLLREIQHLMSKNKASEIEDNLEDLLIIIPIFNSPEVTEACIVSVLKFQPGVRILAIDDCSTDDSIGDLLEMYRKSNVSTFDWKKTPFNLGFPGAANFGMQFRSGKNVLLLNSDVVVSPNFAAKMMRGLREREKVASITCLTNAGETASIPFISENVDLLENSVSLKLNEILDSSDVFKQVSTWPIIPSGVGFCMLLSSKALDVVGDFDEERFSPGYGEENDWSLRAIKKGFINILCPTTYVFHKHGFSYGVAKNQLVEGHLKIINDDFPNYAAEVKNFIQSDPLLYFRQALFLLGIAGCGEIDLRLIIDHQLGGGAVKTLNEEVQSDKKVLNLIVTRLDGGEINLIVKFRNIKEIFYQGKTETIFEILRVLGVRKLLINTVAFTGDTKNTLNLILRLQSEFSLETEFRLHDYHSICPSLNLLNSKGVFCDVPNTDVCKKCLPSNLNTTEKNAPDVESWRSLWFQVLSSCSLITTYSQESCQRFIKVFPELHERITVQRHSVEKIVAPVPRSNRLPSLDQLRIGVVGNLNLAKGSQVVIDLARTISHSQGGSVIFVFGSVQGVPSGLPIAGLGPYSYPWDLYTKFRYHDLDVLLLPSIWPETYNLVSDELADMGIPIVMFAIGAPYERHKDKDIFHFIEFQEGPKLLQTIQKVVEAHYF